MASAVPQLPAPSTASRVIAPALWCLRFTSDDDARAHAMGLPLNENTLSLPVRNRDDIGFVTVNDERCCGDGGSQNRRRRMTGQPGSSREKQRTDDGAERDYLLNATTATKMTRATATASGAR